MKPKTEERIDTVLAGLRQAQPSPEFGERLIARLREPEALERKRAWFRRGNPAPALRGLAVAGAVLAVIALLGPMLRTPHTRHAIAVAHAPAPHVTAIPRPSHAPAAPATVAARTTAEARRVLPRKAVPAHVSPHAESPQPEVASFPAPPMPLTEQERLLLRLKQRGDPVQLAMMTSAAREAAFERDKEQVREFFTPPAPPVQPTPDSTVSGGGTQ